MTAEVQLARAELKLQALIKYCELVNKRWECALEQGAITSNFKNVMSRMPMEIGEASAALRPEIQTDSSGPHLAPGQSVEDFCDAYQEANR